MCSTPEHQITLAGDQGEGSYIAKPAEEYYSRNEDQQSTTALVLLEELFNSSVFQPLSDAETEFHWLATDFDESAQPVDNGMDCEQIPLASLVEGESEVEIDIDDFHSVIEEIESNYVTAVDTEVTADNIEVSLDHDYCLKEDITATSSPCSAEISPKCSPISPKTSPQTENDTGYSSAANTEGSEIDLAGSSLSDDSKSEEGDDILKIRKLLKLTAEEVVIFKSEGLEIPKKLPLSKSEERALKKVRRRIKNKISAKESRLRKKNHMENLEARLASSNVDICSLKRKVESLEEDKKSLSSQVQYWKKIFYEKFDRPKRSTATQTGTMLMVVVLCFALAIGTWSPVMHVSTNNGSVLHAIQNKTGLDVLSDALQDTTYDTPPVRSRVLLGIIENEASNLLAVAPNDSIRVSFDHDNFGFKNNETELMAK